MPNRLLLMLHISSLLLQYYQRLICLHYYSNKLVAVFGVRLRFAVKYLSDGQTKLT